jgi:hypothetical protein
MTMPSPPESREGLAVLALNYERTGPGPDDRVVRFALEFDGRERLRLRVSEDHLGLKPPEVDSGSEASATVLTIPDDVLGPLGDALGRVGHPDDQLWLEFRAPSEDLPALFWEQALQPALKRPLVRIAYTPFRPLASPVPLDVILIGSSPLAKQPLPMADHLNELARAILNCGVVEVTVHIFTDREFFPRLRDLLKDRIRTGSGPGVVIYDPAAAAKYDVPRPTSNLQEAPGVIANPWLRWIGDALPEDRAVDIVHFAGHGYRSYDKGAIALSVSPVDNTDRAWCRFVGAQQIAAFMTQVGAWGIGLSSPQSRFQASSLRLLADNLARVVPGPVSFHDLRSDAECRDLNELYRFVVNPTTCPAPATPNLLYYCHPSPPGETKGLESMPSAAAEFSMVSDATRDLFAPGSRPPRWVAASQRALERSAAELFHRRDQSINIDPKARQGAENALRFLTGLISEGTPIQSGEDMIRGVTAALGRRTEELRKSYESASEALKSLQAPVGTPTVTGPDALRALSQYSKAVDDAHRLVANLNEQRAVPGTLKAAVREAANHLESHSKDVDAACQAMARLASSKDVQELPGKILEQLPKVAANVTQRSDQVRETIRDLSDQFGAALTSPASGASAAPAESTTSPEGGRP